MEKFALNLRVAILTLCPYVQNYRITIFFGSFPNTACFQVPPPKELRFHTTI